MGKLDIKPLQDHTLPLLLSQLPDVAPGISAHDDRNKIHQVLHALSVLCVQPGLLGPLITPMLEKAEHLCSSSTHSATVAESDSDYHECQVAYAFSLLHSIYKSLKGKLTFKHVDFDEHFEAIVPRLFRMISQGLENGDSGIAKDVRFISEAAALIELMTRVSSQE